MLFKPFFKHWHCQPLLLKFAGVTHDENKSTAQRLPEKTQNLVLQVVQVLLLAKTILQYVLQFFIKLLKFVN